MNTSTDRTEAHKQPVAQSIPTVGLAWRIPQLELVSSGDVPRKPLVISLIDDDVEVQTQIKGALEDDGYAVELFPDCVGFLEGHDADRYGCVITDVNMPGMGGIAMLEQLRRRGEDIPVVMMTGAADVSMAVKAMKAGAFHFMEKPFRCADLRSIVEAALDHGLSIAARSEDQQSAARCIARLTARQHQVLDLVMAGHPSKNIAADLGISQRTVDNHRAAIARKTGSSSLPELIRMALTAH